MFPPRTNHAREQKKPTTELIIAAHLARGLLGWVPGVDSLEDAQPPEVLQRDLQPAQHLHVYVYTSMVHDLPILLNAMHQARATIHERQGKGGVLL